MEKSIKELLEAILKQVKDLKDKIVSQERGIELYMSKSSLTADQIDILTSYLKSLTMFIEFLRKDIEELHDIMVCKKI